MPTQKLKNSPYSIASGLTITQDAEGHLDIRIKGKWWYLLSILG